MTDQEKLEHCREALEKIAYPRNWPSPDIGTGWMQATAAKALTDTSLRPVRETSGSHRD